MPEKIFAIIEQPGEQPFRPTFITHQVREKNVDGVFYPARTISFDTDGVGLIRIPDDEFQELNVKKFDHFKTMPAYRGRIVGPFDTAEAAHKKQHELRIKTDAEKAEELPRVVNENAELRKRIAELEKSSGKATTTTPPTK